VDDAVELFFLQIQGSGRIAMPDGDTVRVGYADQNGYPYKSIGRVLVDRGDLPLEKASMEGIKDWGRQHPERLPELLNQNASYVFFRELTNQTGGPWAPWGCRSPRDAALPSTRAPFPWVPRCSSPPPGPTPAAHCPG